MGRSLSSSGGGSEDGRHFDSNKIDLEVGKWYLIEYGFGTVNGKCINFDDTWGTFRFYWGHPWRTYQIVTRTRVIDESSRPPIFCNR